MQRLFLHAYVMVYCSVYVSESGALHTLQADELDHRQELRSGECQPTYRTGGIGGCRAGVDYAIVWLWADRCYSRDLSLPGSTTIDVCHWPANKTSVA